MEIFFRSILSGLMNWQAWMIRQTSEWLAGPSLIMHVSARIPFCLAWAACWSSADIEQCGKRNRREQDRGLLEIWNTARCFEPKHMHMWVHSLTVPVCFHLSTFWYTYCFPFHTNYLYILLYILSIMINIFLFSIHSSLPITYSTVSFQPDVCWVWPVTPKVHGTALSACHNKFP